MAADDLAEALAGLMFHSLIQLISKSIVTISSELLIRILSRTDYQLVNTGIISMASQRRVSYISPIMQLSHILMRHLKLSTRSMDEPLLIQ